MNVYLFSGIFSAFNFGLADGDISIKIQNTNICCDDNLKVLWYSTKPIANFMRRLTNINVL